MKKILLLAAFVIMATLGFGQSTLPLRADTVLIEKVGGSAELKIRNSTRDSLGLFVNIGGGKTRFIKPKKLNDSTLVIGLDTFVVGGSAKIDSAYNGLSRNGTKVQLGNDSNAVGSGGLISTRQIPLNGHSLILGTQSASTGALQVYPAPGGIQITAGPFLDGTIYNTLTAFDTLTAANIGASKARSLQVHRDLRLSDNNLTITGKGSTSAALVVRAKDSMTFDTQGGDLVYPLSGGLSLRQYGGFTGRTLFKGGVNLENDAVPGVLGIVNISGTGAGHIYADGYYASFNSEIVTRIGDTVHGYIKFNGSPGFNLGHINKVYGFYGAPETNADSVWTTYMWGAQTYNYFEGKTGIGVRVPLYRLHVNGAIAFNKDSLPTATGLDSVVLIAPGGQLHKKNLADFAVSGGAPALAQYRIMVGNNANQGSASAVAKIVDTTKALRIAYVHAYNSVRAGDTLHTAKPAKQSVFFGNSITARTISPKYFGYTTRFTNMSNTIEINFGIGGTRMVSLSTGDSAMQERTFLIPTYNASLHEWLFIAYGTNDWRTGSVDSATFRSVTNTVIDAATAKGWPANKIVMISAGYSVTANTSLQHRNKEFVDITLDAGKKKGTRVVDVYTTMITNGGLMGVQADSVHLNEFGNELWSMSVADTLNIKSGDVRASSYMYARQLHIKQYINNPAITLSDSNGVAYNEFRGWHGVSSFDASAAIGLDAMDSLTTGTNNYVFGQEGMRGLTSGIGNVGMGFNVLNRNKTGNYNSVFGNNAGSKLTGSSNTALGAFALQNSVAVSNLTAIGANTLQANTSGINNTAVGSSALIANTTANNSTAVGTNAAVAQTTGGDQTAIGTSALATNQAGTGNTAIGYLALTTLNGGVGSTAVGKNAGRFSAGSASLNSYFGFGAGEQQTSASRNTFIGASAGKLSNSGGNNSILGYSAGDSITTGTDNLFLGYQAAFNLQTAATRNIFIGQNAGLGWRFGNDNIMIGPYLVPANTGWNNRLIISNDGDTVLIASDSTRNVGIRTLNPTATLDIAGDLRIRTVTNGGNNDSLLAINNGVVEKVARMPLNVVSAAGTLAIAAGNSQAYYTFNGTTTTWTLPAITGNTGLRITIMNQGSGNITLNSNAGANDIVDGTSLSNTYLIAPGEVGTFYNNSLKYTKLN